MILDEGQGAKAMGGATRKALLQIRRTATIILSGTFFDNRWSDLSGTFFDNRWSDLSGTFFDNRWSDVAGICTFLDGHPFQQNLARFNTTFASKDKVTQKLKEQVDSGR